MAQLFAGFNSYTFLVVAAGAAVLGLLSGIVGTFVVLRKQSLLGDAVSHSALPGIALAFMATGIKSSEVLLAGALISGLVATFFINAVVRRSKLTYDTALALIMSVFFGIGTIFMSVMQKIPDSNQAGIGNFIFGNAAAMLYSDVVVLAVLSLVIITVVMLFWKELKLFTFDAEFARSIGVSGTFLNALISFLTVLTIIAGLQTVGVVLMSAMLIAPAVAARQWTDRLSSMAALAAGFGAVSGVLGTMLSDAVTDMPTGPAIVIFVSAFAFLSILFAPQRGVISKLLLSRKRAKKFAEEAASK